MLNAEQGIAVHLVTDSQQYCLLANTELTPNDVTCPHMTTTYVDYFGYVQIRTSLFEPARDKQC